MEQMVAQVQNKKHNAFKDSGMEWFGKVPEHWGFEKGKWLFHKEERPVREEDDIVTAFRDGEVTLRKNRRTDGFTNSIKEHGYQGIRQGDLVIHSMDAFAGAIGVSDSNGKSTPVYSACTPRDEENVNPYFYAYLLRNLAKTGFIESLAKGIRQRSTDFRFNDFRELLLLQPPIDEQNRIVSFVDKKTAQIDKAIAQKERLIELLNERRQIVIHKAVTHGLNPDAPMKDSGVEWIGEIPEHWEVKRLASFGKFSKGRGISRDDLTQQGLPAVLYGDIYTKYDFFINEVYHKTSKDTAKKASKISKNSLLFTGSGETREEIGKCVVYLNNQPAFAGGDIIIFEPSENDSLFLSYVLNSKGANIEKAKNAKGEIIIHIYASKLKDIYIPIPASEEQRKIVHHLNTANKKIDIAISYQEKEIKKLKEYKKSLINSAVTGKIKV